MVMQSARVGVITRAESRRLLQVCVLDNEEAGDSEKVVQFKSDCTHVVPTLSSSRCSSLGANMDDSVATTKSGSHQTHTYDQQRKTTHTEAGTSAKATYAADKKCKRRIHSDGGGGANAKVKARGTSGNQIPSVKREHVGFNDEKAKISPADQNTRLGSKRKLQTISHSHSQQDQHEMKAMVSDILLRKEKEHLKKMEEKYNFNFASEEPVKKGKWVWEKES